MLESSRPRRLRLARSVSSRTIFVGVLLILMSLLITEAVAQVIPPGPPRNVRATGGDRKVTLYFSPPSTLGTYSDVWWYEYKRNDDQHWRNTNKANTSVVLHENRFANGATYTFLVRVVSSDGTNDHHGPFVSVEGKPMMPAPAAFSATAGDGQVRLSWMAIPQLPPQFLGQRDVTDYEYSPDDGSTWTSTTSTNPTKTVSGLENGRPYSFKVRGVRGSEARGLPSRTVRVTPLGDAPGTPGTLNVERVEDTATLTWNPPTEADEQILRYEYSDDGGSNWKSTGSTRTTYTVTGLEAGETYTFLVRALYVDGTPSRVISHRSRSSNAAVLTVPKPKRRVIQDCPVGWVRSDGFAGRNRRVLIYEVNLQMDMRDRVSIYKPVWVAIYVHPDEALENLEGWKLQVAVPYNRHREYLLTAENSVVVDAGFVEGGFAFIKNPEENPFPMTGVGFVGSPAPGFDYRLYDDTGRRIDFGISCYKRFDVFQVLKDLEDPRVLRNVSLKDIDWNASWFIRSEWTLPLPVNAPGAPSLQGVNLVGKWADLKKK